MAVPPPGDVPVPMPPWAGSARRGIATTPTHPWGQTLLAGCVCRGHAQPYVCVLPPQKKKPRSGYFRETIRRDIRRAREMFRGEQLSRELARIQQRLDSVELLSLDIIVNLLLSYRDVQVGI